MLKRLPIGEQDFAGLVEFNAIYADKTELIFNLFNLSKYVFLSRPRRFGKSLLISVLKYLFEGRKELFSGLWIEDKIEWKKIPVVRIDFTSRSFFRRPLTLTINEILSDNARQYDLELFEDDNRNRFMELVEKLQKKTGEKVVVLVDEYDKPLVEYINEPEKAEENRLILRNFYGVLKPCSDKLRMVFFTGISRFSKLSIFSELNNLVDISMDKNFSDICGFTKDDLNKYFSEYKELACKELHLSPEELDNEITYWYDGYKFDGETHIYNPFSMLNFFSRREFKNYWFDSGLPKLLVDFISSHGIDIRKFEGISVTELALNNFDITKIDIVSLMFQTGYLTIMEKNFGRYILDYPNEEVRSSFTQFFLQNYVDTPQSDKTLDMAVALDRGNIDGFIAAVNSLLASIPYKIIEAENENYFSSLMHVLLRTLGYMVNSELMSYRDRADAVIKAKNFIYVFEYKMAPHTAAEGMEQIKSRGYADEFRTDPRNKTAVSFVIDREQRKITDYITEKL